MYTLVDELFLSCNLKVCGGGIYTDKGDEDDLFQFMVVAGVLPKRQWFPMFVKQWDWYEETEEPEDLIELFKLAG